MRLLQAFSVFFKILGNPDFAEQVGKLAGLNAPATAKESAPVAAKPTPPTPKPPARNDAVTLLAALQREARFVDIVMEPLDGYSDAQVGAATRDVLKECAKVIERLFAIRPLSDAAEGANLETHAKVDAAKYKLTGKVEGNPPYRGALVHHGWQVTRCELPTWQGSADASNIVAPIELELR